MKLKDIINETSIDNIIKALEKNYSFLKKDKTKFINFYNFIKEEAHFISNNEEEFKIFIRESIDDFDSEKYIQVSGIKTEDLNALSNNKENELSVLNLLLTWSLIAVNHEQWLNMEIIKYDGFNFSNDEIVALCIFEMTYLGFDNKKELI